MPMSYIISSTCGSWYPSQPPYNLLWGDCVPPFLTRIFWAHTIAAGKCTLGCTLPHGMWDSPRWQ